MLPFLLWFSLSWPPFQLLNVRRKFKGWRATPYTFLRIGIHLLDSLLVVVQRYLVNSRVFSLEKVLIEFLLSAQTPFMKPSYSQRLQIFHQTWLNWAQGLKIQRKEKHAHPSQARNWTPLSLAGMPHLQPAHIFLQSPISKQKKTLKVACDWGMVSTD